MLRWVSPLSSRASASRFWCGVSFSFRPNLTPLARASARPRVVRSMIRRRSSLAATPSIARTTSAKSEVVSTTGVSGRLAALEARAGLQPPPPPDDPLHRFVRYALAVLAGGARGEEPPMVGAAPAPGY